MNETKPFDIGLAMRLIRTAVRPWPKAALFELAEDGFKSTFEQLVACIISIRTYDEVTLPVSRKLFERARTSAEVSELTYEELDALISQSTFHERKASQIFEIARRYWIDINRLLVPLANIFAPEVCHTAPPVRCWICAG